MTHVLNGDTTVPQRGRPHHCGEHCTRLVAAYEAGAGVSDLAADTGMKMATIYGILRRHQTKMRTQGSRGTAALTRAGRPILRTQVPEITKLYVDEHRTLQYIADRFGVTRERVRQVLRESGIRAEIRGHRCDALCHQVLAMPRPLDTMKASIETGRPYQVVHRIAKTHGIQTFGKRPGGRHRCNERCTLIRDTLVANPGINYTQLLKTIGMKSNLNQRFRAYHPDFPWPTSQWWKREEYPTKWAEQMRRAREAAQAKRMAKLCQQAAVLGTI